MKIAAIPFAVLRFQYQIARFPFQLIENQIAARLGSEAPARLFYERSLGTVDATVGKLLGDPELEKRGAALVERSDTLGRAARLGANAAQRREQADAKLDATRDEVVTDIRDARRDRAGNHDARTTAEERKGAAEEAAEKRAAAAKKRADDVAAQRRNAAEAAQRQKQAKIRAAEKKATEAAESKLDDAQAKRSDAARKRAQADRVEELADIEKQKRRSERANNT
jgi:hypothetical protein